MLVYRQQRRRLIGEVLNARDRRDRSRGSRPRKPRERPGAIHEDTRRGSARRRLGDAPRVRARARVERARNSRSRPNTHPHAPGATTTDGPADALAAARPTARGSPRAPPSRRERADGARARSSSASASARTRVRRGAMARVGRALARTRAVVKRRRSVSRGTGGRTTEAGPRVRTLVCHSSIWPGSADREA